MFAHLNPLKWRTSTKALWISFLLPVIIMTVYFGFRGMAPFGSSSILTVDLGQQYIDFFESYRHALFSDPLSIFYSFAKGLGGETYGDWAYYLLSPTNLLLLPFSNTYLPIGILFL
ncbi:YfhO family protein, partial [Weissella cibaria]